MAEPTFSAALVGCTGLVGSHILSGLVANPSVAPASIHAIARRALPTTSEALKPHISTDTNSWSSYFTTINPPPKVFFSALGTTRAQAGSLSAQRAIDHDLNISLAKAAQAAGVQTYVLISSGGSNSASWMPYLKMKGELEDEIKKIGFKHTVILRPGLLVGVRQDTRMAEAIVRNLTNWIGVVHQGFKDMYAQDADVVANAAIAAGMQCAEGKRENGIWVVEQKDVIRLGRTEWNQGK